MEKIISLFKRNYDGDRLVRDEIVEGAEWVVNGEGVATRKIDGTSCLVQDGRLYKRYDAKKGRTPPTDFLPAQPEADPIAGHWPGWVPVRDDRPDDRYHIEAFEESLPDGTYELLGPKVQGNPEGFERHTLVRHGAETVEAPRNFDALKAWLAERDIEGLVWHHPDGRMVKIKKKDFGLSRKPAVIA